MLEDDDNCYRADPDDIAVANEATECLSVIVQTIGFSDVTSFSSYIFLNMQM